MKVTLTSMVMVLLMTTIIMAENPDSRTSISFGIATYTNPTKTSSGLLGMYFNPEKFEYWSKFTMPSNENLTLHLDLNIRQISDNFLQVEPYPVLNIGVSFTYYLGNSINK